MADDPDKWFNEKAASFCDGMKESIDSLKFLSSGHREHAKAWLDEACPQPGDRERTGTDPVTSFNAKLPRIIKHVEFFGQTKIDQKMIT